MLPRLRQKCAYRVPLLPRSLSTGVFSAEQRLLRHFEPLVDLNCHRGGTQVRFYAQQPPNNGGFPGFSFQQQRSRGEALKEFVGPFFVHL